MGQQVIDKLKEYRAANSGNTPFTGDKQHPFPVKKMPPRELLNETQNTRTKPPVLSPPSKDSSSTADTVESRNTISKQPGSSPLSKDRGRAADTVETRNINNKPVEVSLLSRDTVAAMLAGTKRKHTDSPTTSGLRSPFNNAPNAPIVYVRRKLDTEPGKSSTSEYVQSVTSQNLKKCGIDNAKGPEVRKELTQEPQNTVSALLVSATVTSRPKPDEELPPSGAAGMSITRLSAIPFNSTVPIRSPIEIVPASPRNPVASLPNADEKFPPSGFPGKSVTGLPTTSSNLTVPSRAPTEIDPPSSRNPVASQPNPDEKLPPSDFAGKSVTDLPAILPNPTVPSRAPIEIDPASPRNPVASLPNADEKFPPSGFPGMSVTGLPTTSSNLTVPSRAPIEIDPPSSRNPVASQPNPDEELPSSFTGLSATPSNSTFPSMSPIEIDPPSLANPVESRPNPYEELPSSGLAGKLVTGLRITSSNTTVHSMTPTTTVPSMTPIEIDPPSPRNLVASLPNPDEEIPRYGLSRKPITGLPATPFNSIDPRMTPIEIDPPSPRNLDWKERFLRLQTFLKSCDQSSQESYILKLRSLSAAGRSRHAVDLEKRAIQLLVEEGIELHRMKVLNVLGKALPKEALLTEIPSPLQAQAQGDDKLVSAAKLS